MAIRSLRWAYPALVIGLGGLLAGCGSQQAPTAAPTTGRPPAAASATPQPAGEAPATAAPSEPTAAPVEPTQVPAADASPAAEVPAQASAAPRWILAGSVIDIVEGINHLVAIDADTGTSRPVCSLTGSYSVSPDGRWIACSYRFADPDLRLFDLAALPQIEPSTDLSFTPPQLPTLDVALPEAVYVSRVAWSPDSTLLALSTSSGLYIVEPDTNGQANPLLACDNDRCSGIAWSPDGQLLAFGREDGLFVLDQAGTERRLTGYGITPRDPALYQEGEPVDVTDLRWSDDGRRISYATKSGVFEVEAFSDNTDQAPLSSTPYQTPGPTPSTPALSPDGSCAFEVRQTKAEGLVNDPPEGPDDYILAEYGVFAYLPANPGVAVQLGDIPFDSQAEWIAGGEPALPLLKETAPALRGCAVLEVQSLLQERGYAVGSIDGIYGTRTAEAVRDFQRDNGLDTDAVVGPATWAKLR